MASFGDVISSVGSGSMSTLWVVIWIFIAIFAVTLILGLFYLFVWRKRRWNLKVEIKLTRGDGKVTHGEWGQGKYDSKRGVVFIKRPGTGTARPIPMKIFDVRKYMQGPDLITVIQVGPEDFRPVLNESWTEHDVEYDDTEKPIMEGGKPKLDADGDPMYETEVVKESILNIRTETGLNKAWKAAWEEAAKNAYTIQSFLRQYSAPISVGIVVISCFVGFAVLWTKLSSICG